MPMIDTGRHRLQLYFAGANRRPLFESLATARVDRILVSWRVLRPSTFDRFLPHLEGRHVILDPGFGFGGRFSEYVAFAKAYAPLWEACLAWDVPGGDPILNTDWLLRSGTAGLPKLMPVFQPGMPWRFIRAMQDLCGRVAFGGLLLMPLHQRKQYLDQVFFLPSGALRNPDLQAHACGIDHPKLLARYPWYSADSTSWINPLRFGEPCELAEAIDRMRRKEEHHWDGIGHSRWVYDPAQELAYGCETIPRQSLTPESF